MKTQCPECKAIFRVPDVYEGRDIKCRNCQSLFEPALYEKPPIVVPTEELPRPSRGNFVTKAWAKSPAAFRVAFLATMGVISALTLSFYAYQKIFFSHKTAPIEHTREVLAHDRLFPANFIGQYEVLRGRRLREHRFAPDATDDMTRLSVWLNERGEIVGISAQWYGNRWLRPADVRGDNGQQLLRSTAVYDGFVRLTGFDLSSLADATFLEEGNQQKCYASLGKWAIDVTRMTPLVVFDQGSDKHNDWCDLNSQLGGEGADKVDYGVYFFLAIAQNW